MLTKQDKENLRGTIFRHLDGVATSTTAFALHNKGVLQYLLDHQKVNLQELTSYFKANEGYLNIALRVLCAQGWLTQHIDNKNDVISYETNENSKTAFELVHLYEDVVKLLNYSVKFPEERIGPDAFSALEKIFKKFGNKEELIKNKKNF